MIAKKLQIKTQQSTPDSILFLLQILHTATDINIAECFPNLVPQYQLYDYIHHINAVAGEGVPP